MMALFSVISDCQLSAVVSKERILVDLDEVKLPYSRYGNQELPDASVVSRNPSTDYCSAVSEMSSRDSGHQLSPELPHSRYYGDQELPDAAIGASSCNTIVSYPSTDYFSAVSEMSSHDSGHRLSPVGSVLSSEDEILELEGSNNSGILKKNSSSYLFIPRGLSSGPWKSMASRSCSENQINDSTTTSFYHILKQLSGSSEEEMEQRSNERFRH